jgi:hypothetical protein
MLEIRELDPVAYVPLLLDGWSPAGRRTGSWAAFCRDRGFVVFAAEEDGELAGFAVAESHPRFLLVLTLEGTAEACRLLLALLVRRAGERHVHGWFPADRPDVRDLLVGAGFEPGERGTVGGRRWRLYHRDASR